MLFGSALPHVVAIPYKPSRIRRFVLRICFTIAFIAVVIASLVFSGKLIERSHNPYVHPARTHRYANPPASDPH